MNNPIFDDEYSGPRWRYGLSLRPVSAGGVPRGFVVFSDHPDARFPTFGTIDFPFPIDPDVIVQMDLTPVEPQGKEVLDIIGRRSNRDPDII